MRLRMRFPGVVYAYYERKLRRSLARDRIPEHIGVMVDGNRRWAKLAGAPTSDGHQAGADKILEFLGWCQELGVRRVTLYMLSTDNLNRDADELDPLLDIIGNTLDRLGEKGDLRVNAVGALDILPPNLAEKLNALGTSTSGANGLHVNVAIGYGGRREIVDAVKELLNDAAAHGKTIKDITEELCDTQISEYLYTRGQPDPELVIRPSGEMRLSNFLPWQTVYSEFVFMDVLWPDFDEAELDKALEDYARKYYYVADIPYRWSAQLYEPADGLPYIGQMPGGDDHTYVATGFSGNGMIYGTLAGNMIADHILGHVNKYETLLSPSRMKPVAGFTEFVKENADVAYRFVADRLRTQDIDSLAELAHGTGMVVKYQDEKLAIYKDNSGKVTALNPVCTHAGCIVNFNQTEQSWDCPCHGGRYDCYGKVITGPPTKDLSQIQVD